MSDERFAFLDFYLDVSNQTDASVHQNYKQQQKKVTIEAG
jgi:hypothetical protein